MEKVQLILASAPDGDEVPCTEEEQYTMDEEAYAQQFLKDQEIRAKLAARKTAQPVSVEDGFSLNSSGLMASSRADTDAAESIQEEARPRLTSANLAALPNAEGQAIAFPVGGSRSSVPGDLSDTPDFRGVAHGEALDQDIRLRLALRNRKQQAAHSDDSSSFNLDSSRGNSPALSLRSGSPATTEHADGEE